YQALLTIHVEKLVRKSLKPCKCCGGKLYLRSASSSTLSKQRNHTCLAGSSITKGRCLALMRGGPNFWKYRGGPPRRVTKNNADLFDASAISAGNRCRISDFSNSL